MRAFSFMYIGRYPLILLLVVLPQPFRLLAALLLINAIPYVWCRWFLAPYMERKRPVEPRDLSGVTELYGLSPRESEILGLIMTGMINRDIEEALFISYHTVKNHVYNLYRKIGVKTRFEPLHKLSSCTQS